MARLFIVMILCLLTAFAPAGRAEAREPLRELIRLQVLASGDSDEQQLEKLRVRDRVREAAAGIVKSAKDADEAYALLRQCRGELERASGARVEIRTLYSPVRVYGRTVVPAGKYRTVRIILGEGAGRNWWCVLYPDLCGVDPLEVEALEKDQPVVFYSEIMRWMRAMKGDDAV
jgi:stage II sporulation protein R